MGKAIKHTKLWHMKQAKKYLRRIERLGPEDKDLFERYKRKGAAHIKAAQSMAD